MDGWNRDDCLNAFGSARDLLPRYREAEGLPSVSDLKAFVAYGSSHEPWRYPPADGWSQQQQQQYQRQEWIDPDSFGYSRVRDFALQFIAQYRSNLFDLFCNPETKTAGATAARAMPALLGAFIAHKLGCDEASSLAFATAVCIVLSEPAQKTICDKLGRD